MDILWLLKKKKEKKEEHVCHGNEHPPRLQWKEGALASHSRNQAVLR